MKASMRIVLLLLISLPILSLVSCGSLEESGEQQATPDAQVQSVSPTTTASGDGWVTYVNEVIGFALDYPTGWRVKDSSSTGGPQPPIWVIEFRDLVDNSKALALVKLEKPVGTTLADWAEENYCDPVVAEIGPSVPVAGTEGLTCWLEVLDGRSDHHVLFEAGNYFFDFQASETVSEEHYQRALHSLQVFVAK